jgi:tetratricopeptide (TPR) repeat protein
MANASSVNELVLHWQELREQGRAASAEELCADRPELLDEFRRQIEALVSMEQFLGASGDDTPSGPPVRSPELAAQAETPPTIRLERGANTADGGAPLVGSRYRPLRLHARGGLGEVFIARDEELSREVALKRIRWPHAGDGDCRRRFLREGEITGGLEHPGVVPVYGLTQDADGQPCYAMRFVRGQTLQEAIARFHAAAEADRHLALRQLLGRFVAVCNTMAYAHSRGVIHRDLKPANIMLGDFGETLVVDWGLAKRVSVAGESNSLGGNCWQHDPSDGHDDLTATGELLGTPAFMSPEQAAGRHSTVGPASDIYGLGATLYALLTGRSPFSGERVEVLRKVARGDISQPRELQPDIPRALEAICLKAMAREPSARYATALELAADLERWLADELVRVYPEPLGARARRWVRRHRTLVTTLAAVLGVSSLLVVGAGGWLAARQAETDRALHSDLDEAARLLREEKWADARAAVQRAEGRLSQGAPQELRRRLAQERADLTMAARLDALRQGRSAISNETLDFDTASAVAGYADAFRDYGLNVEADAKAVAQTVRESRIKESLLAALDDWAEHTPHTRLRAQLLAVARQADPDPWRDRFRDPDLRADVGALRRLAAAAPINTLSPIVLEALVNRLWRAGVNDLELVRRMQARHPSDYFLNGVLARSLDDRAWHARDDEAMRLRDEAIGYVRAAMAVRPESSMAWTDLGVLLFHQGRYVECEAAHRKAIALQPDNPRPHMLLSAPLRAQGRLEEAEQSARRAIALNPGHGPAYSMLANTLLLRERFWEAEDAARTAIRLQPGYAYPYRHLAVALRSRRKYGDAQAAEQRAISLRPGLVSDESLWAAGEMAHLEGKLSDWLDGRATPADARELAVLAFMASHYEFRYRAAAELCAKSFAEKPDFAQATVNWLCDRPRYYAACCAARASVRDGDAATLSFEDRGRWRRQAVEWLRQELTYWEKQLAGGLPAARSRATRALTLWQTDGWLTALRSAPNLPTLPPAEREDCRKLWADVARLLQRAQVDAAGGR